MSRLSAPVRDGELRWTDDYGDTYTVTYKATPYDLDWSLDSIDKEAGLTRAEVLEIEDLIHEDIDWDAPNWNESDRMDDD